MTDSVVAFVFEANNVEILVEGEELLFRASSVAKCLGYANPSKLVELLGDATIPQRDVRNVDGALRKVPFLTEKQLYKGILRSQAKNAEPFQDWVAGTVLPSIRKKGGYVAPGADPARFFQGMNSEQLQYLTDTMKAKEQAEVAAVEAQGRLDHFASLDGLVSLTAAFKQIGLKPKLAMAWLREAGYLNQHNQPTAVTLARKSGPEYFQVKSITIRPGQTVQQTLVSNNGMLWLHGLSWPPKIRIAARA
jgi:prophage antirepressor-like protein